MKALTKKAGSQRGLTIFGGVLLLLFVSAIALLVIRLAPVYIENFTVKRVLGDIVDDGGLAYKEPYQVSQAVRERMRQSAIHDQKHMKVGVKRSAGTTIVTVDYTVLRPVVGNLSALMEFHERAEIKAH